MQIDQFDMNAESRDHQVNDTCYVLEITESMTENLMLRIPRSSRAALKHALKRSY